MSQGNDSLKFYVLILVILLILAFVSQNWILWLLFILAILFGALKIMPSLNNKVDSNTSNMIGSTKIKIKLDDEVKLNSKTKNSNHNTNKKVESTPKPKTENPTISKEDKETYILQEIWGKIINNSEINNSHDASNELYQIIGTPKRNDYFNILISKNGLNDFDGQHIINSLIKKIESTNFEDNKKIKDKKID
jgi:hypothetical protein